MGSVAGPVLELIGYDVATRTSLYASAKLSHSGKPLRHRMSFKIVRDDLLRKVLLKQLRGFRGDNPPKLHNTGNDTSTTKFCHPTVCLGYVFEDDPPRTSTADPLPPLVLKISLQLYVRAPKCLLL